MARCVSCRLCVVVLTAACVIGLAMPAIAGWNLTAPVQGSSREKDTEVVGVGACDSAAGTPSVFVWGHYDSENNPPLYVSEDDVIVFAQAAGPPGMCYWTGEADDTPWTVSPVENNSYVPDHFAAIDGIVGTIDHVVTE